MRMGLVLPVWTAGEDRCLSQAGCCGRLCLAYFSGNLNYSQQLTHSKKMETTPNPPPATEKKIKQKTTNGATISFSCRPRGLEDAKGSELLAPFVQKSLLSGSPVCPSSPEAAGKERSHWLKGRCAPLSPRA